MGATDFNVSLIVKDTHTHSVTTQCLQTTNSEEKGEPKRIRTEVPLLTSLTAGPNRLTTLTEFSCRFELGVL